MVAAAHPKARHRRDPAVAGSVSLFAATVVPAALGHINFATDDGLYVALAGLIEKIRRGKQVAMVGDGHRGHFLPRRLIKKLGGFASAVEQAEVRVDVKMNELRLTHGTRL